MNDDELITAVRESFTGVHSTTPATQIVKRGRTMRARRRIPAVTGALAVAGVAALALTTLLPAGQAGHQPAARLAAWTVTKQADGNVKVTIRELRDPAGLQRTLRADGIPASVTFAGQPNPSCQGFPGGGTQDQRRQRLTSVVTAPAAGQDVMIIHPSALPSGAGLQISTDLEHHPGPQDTFQGFSIRLVQASPQCTGTS